MKLFNFFRKIFVGPKTTKYQYTHPAIKNQWRNLLKVWNDEKEATFGIERLLRLFLTVIQFVFPSLYIRHFSGKVGLLCRKLSQEAYVFIKTFLPILYLYFGVDGNFYILMFNTYFILDTVFYLLGLIFLSDIYVRPISQKRSFLLLMLNYIEMSLCFSVLYKGLGVISGINSNVQAIYFSFVTSTTLGYGEFHPSDFIGQTIVVFQLLIMALFVFLFFSTISSRINEKNNSFNGKKS